VPQPRWASNISSQFIDLLGSEFFLTYHLLFTGSEFTSIPPDWDIFITISSDRTLPSAPLSAHISLDLLESSQYYVYLNPIAQINFPILTLKFLPSTFITSSYTINLTQNLPSAYNFVYFVIVNLMNSSSTLTIPIAGITFNLVILTFSINLCSLHQLHTLII
jgi:hypothetical protein